MFSQRGRSKGDYNILRRQHKEPQYSADDDPRNSTQLHSYLTEFISGKSSYFHFLLCEEDCQLIMWGGYSQVKHITYINLV